MRQVYADLKWICFECGMQNTLKRLQCKECSKYRWAQLGFVHGDRVQLAARMMAQMSISEQAEQ